MQGVTKGFKELKRVSKPYGVTGVRKGYKGLQRVTKGYKGLQGVTRG